MGVATVQGIAEPCPGHCTIIIYTVGPTEGSVSAAGVAVHSLVPELEQQSAS